MDTWAASRTPDVVEVFRVGGDGLLRTSAFTDASGKWAQWSPVAPAGFPAHQPVCALASAADALHAFVVDGDGLVQAFVRPGSGLDGQWLGPHAVPGIATAGDTVAGVSRSAGTLDLFAQGTEDNALVTASWKAGRGPLGAWSAWSPVGDPAVSAEFDGGQFCAVARDAHSLDVFAKHESTIAHASWQQTGGNWTSWTAVRDPALAAGRPSAVSRTPTSVDVFIIDDFKVATSDLGILAGLWRGWFGSDQVADANPVRAVARGPQDVEVFGVATVGGAQGVVHASVHFPPGADPQWGKWEMIPGDSHFADSRLCAVARKANLVEVFVNGDKAVFVARWDASAAAGQKWTAWSAAVPSGSGLGSGLKPKLPKELKKGMLPNNPKLLKALQTAKKGPGAGKSATAPPRGKPK